MNEKEKLTTRIVFSDSPRKEMKAIRMEKGIMQKELAKKMKITQSTLSGYEAGRRKNPGGKICQKVFGLYIISFKVSFEVILLWKLTQ